LLETEETQKLARIGNARIPPHSDGMPQPQVTSTSDGYGGELVCLNISTLPFISGVQPTLILVPSGIEGELGTQMGMSGDRPAKSKHQGHWLPHVGLMLV
jgi:hypothetical protein